MINFGFERVNTSECNVLMNLSQCSLPIDNQQASWLTVLRSPSATSSAWLQNSDSWTSQTAWLQSMSSGHNVLCCAVVSLSTEGNAKTLREIPRSTSIKSAVNQIAIRLASVLLLSVFPTNVLYAFLPYPMCATCPANPTVYLIALIILSEDCKLNMINISRKFCTTKCWCMWEWRDSSTPPEIR
jgi:hypothetical protein